MQLGAMRNRIVVENPAVDANGKVINTPDGDGGFTQTFVAASPDAWWASIAKATVNASERLFAATVTAHATHILNGRFHAGITTKTRLSWVDRAGVTHVANVLDADDVDGAGVESLVLVSEIAP